MINCNQNDYKNNTFDYKVGKVTTTAQAPGREEAASACVSDLVLLSDRGWEGREVKRILSDQWVSWVSTLADWTTFITLTFREDKPPDVARSLFQWFVRQNNVHAFGKHYTRKVGHSYFSYVVGLEYQRRDVVHFHVLVDKPLDFSFVHGFWGSRCGFAWIEKVEAVDRAVGYVCKYIMKGGEVEVFRAKKDYQPEVQPAWWVDRSKCVSRASAASERSEFTLDTLLPPDHG